MPPGRGNLLDQHAVVQRAGLAQRLPDGKTIEQPVGDVVRVEILAVGNGVTVGAFVADNRDVEQFLDCVAVGVESPPRQRTTVIERAALPAGADLGQRDGAVAMEGVGQPDVPFKEIGCHGVRLFSGTKVVRVCAEILHIAGIFPLYVIFSNKECVRRILADWLLNFAGEKIRK